MNKTKQILDLLENPTKEMSDLFWNAYIPEPAGAQATSYINWHDFTYMLREVKKEIERLINV